MKPTSPLQQRRASRAGVRPPRATLTAVAGAVLLVGAGTAWAQDSQTIEITGIRRAIESAISAKKNADGVMESISAEDIGKLPDPSVADAVSRLPGVAAQRNSATGKSAGISVRGMPRDFASGLLNGREQASSDDSRAVNFDLFPSELLFGVDIHKTGSASLMGQGLSGTINLKTVRPLEFGRRAISGGYRGQKTGIDSGAGEGSGDRLTLSYIDQFADRTIGVALGFARFKEKGAEQLRFNSWGGWAPQVGYQATPGGPITQVTTPGGFTADTERTEQDRTGAMGILQFRPFKGLDIVLDYFHSEGKSVNSKKGFEGPVGGLSAGGYDPGGTAGASGLVSQLINATVVGGVAESGTITNFKGVVRNHDEVSDEKLDAFGLNARWQVGGWAGVADLGQSKVSKHNTRYETTAGIPGNATAAGFAGTLGTISWTGFNGNNFDQVRYTSSLNYSDPNIARLTDVMGWSGGEGSPQAGYVALPTTIDKIDTLRLSGSHALNFGPLTGLELGANYSERDKRHTANEGRLVIRGSADPYASVAVPGAGVSTAGPTGIPIITWNPQGSLGTVYDLPAKVDADILNKDWKVNERVTTLYAMGQLDTKVAGMALSGNVGTQVVQTEQSGTGSFINRDTCTGNTAATCPSVEITRGANYTDLLPSANFALDLGGDQKLRMGVGRTLARAAMADMRGSARISVSTTRPEYPGGVIIADAGNPELLPFKADGVDLSYEKYFGTRGLIAVAAFYKDLKTFILRTERLYDFRGLAPVGTPLPNGGIGLMTQPVNGNGGRISGFELTASIPFDLLAKPLAGFGVQVNYARTDSSVDIPTAGLSTADVGTSTIPLPGLSKDVTNITLYYERAGFQFRVSERRRSSYLGEISDFQDNRQFTFVQGEAIVDAQIGYEFRAGPLKGLSALFQMNNLTNEEFVRYNAATGGVVERKKYGKTYLLGANYKF